MFFKLFSHIRIAFFLLISPPFLVSQSAPQVIEKSLDFSVPFTVSQISIKEPSFRRHIRCAVSRPDGSLLLATDEGIVEFNSNKFSSFLNSEKTDKKMFYKLYWNEGSKKLFGSTLRHSFYQLYPKLVKFPGITAVTLKGDSLFGMDSLGVLYVSAASNANFKPWLTLGIEKATCLSIQNNTIYVGTEQALYMANFSGKFITLISGKNLDLFDFLPGPYPNEIFVLGRKQIYEVSAQKVGSFFSVSEATQVLDVKIRDLSVVGKETYVITLTNGLVLRKNKSQTFYSVKDGLLSEFIETAYYNKYGNYLFIGTNYKGALKAQFKTCFSLSVKNGFLPPGSICSVINSPTNGILTIDTKGRMFKYNRDKVIPYINIRESTASLAEIDGNLYAGTWNKGLYIVKNRQVIKHLTDKLELHDNSLISAFKDKSGMIWLGCYSGISRGKSLETIRPYLRQKITGTIICFYELRNGTICIGGDKGFSLIDKKGNIIAHYEQGMEGTEVRSFYEDKEGKLWIGTHKKGLFCLFRNRLVHINSMKGCALYNEVFCLAPDSMGYLYMTSNHGLWRVEEKALSDFYYLKKEYLVPFYYGEQDGILDTEFNGGFQNNFAQDENGHLFLPTQQGLVLLKPETIMFKKIRPLISQIMVNDTLFKEQQLIFSPLTNSIKFSFLCQAELEKSNVYYQYTLESGSGTVLPWSPLQKEKTVDFKLLPPDKYCLLVRAIDGSNDPNPLITKYKFEVLPFIYQTLWFKLSAVGLLIAVTLLLIKWRINHHRNEIQKKEKYKLHTLELELRAIHAELNPHFVFNCINSIKYFVMEQNYDSANNGLMKLSRLIRSTVEDSDKLFLALSRELKSVTNYIELEKLRFQNQLHYQVTIDEHISGDPFIPHLLIQPFVENAIKHGIAHLVNRVGSLLIDVKQEDDLLICTIIDNGIGRAASALLNQNLSFHESKGLKLVQEKMDLLNAFYNYRCSCTTTDLFYGEQSSGTMIVIEMQANYKPVNIKRI